MPEWKTIHVADIASKKGLVGGPFGSSLGSKDYVPSGVPVIRGVNLGSNGKFDAREFVFVSQEKVDRDLSRNLAKPGDVVFTQRGTLGQVGIVPPTPYERYVISQSQMRLRVDPAIASAEFIYYQFKSPEMIAAIYNHAITTGVPHINLGILGSLELSIPSLPVQRAIAAVLGALDDKIAVNDRIASTTDLLTATLLEQILTEDTETSNVALSSVASVNQRKVKPINGGHLRYIDISSVSVGRIEWPDRIPWVEAPGRARRGVSPGDTIWSTVRPGRRSHTLMLDDDPELVASTGFAVLTPTRVGPAFLYEVTKRNDFVQYLESVAEGSAYPAVRAERFEQALVPLPSLSRLESFEQQAIALRRRAHAAEQESRILAELRDTLLPKLMSGEIRVRDAERRVEETV